MINQLTNQNRARHIRNRKQVAFYPSLRDRYRNHPNQIWMSGKNGEKHDKMGEFYVQTWNWEKNQECWVGVLPHIHLFLHIVFNNLFILSFWSLDWGLTWDDISFQKRNYPIQKSVRQKGLKWAFRFIYGMISCVVVFFGGFSHTWVWLKMLLLKACDVLC